ncbi:hypothetical protein [Streptomyces sp. GESEQ-35]|uniref:hypothetical protein n=1 Tax=Streptomyces sp. GESEQ-35 TaxID=2812657 RepID=UPI001B322428|nr:hypothetical protein [Streptomyces sp. GESEQ-35]
MRTTPRRPIAVAAAAICTAVLLAVSACGNDNGPKEPADSTGLEEVITDVPEPDPEPADETDLLPADPDWEYVPDEPSVDPRGGTNPCAFYGDPLCPDTPIVIPAPDLGSW